MNYILATIVSLILLPISLRAQVVKDSINTKNIYVQALCLMIDRSFLYQEKGLTVIAYDTVIIDCNSEILELKNYRYRGIPFKRIHLYKEFKILERKKNYEGYLLISGVEKGKDNLYHVYCTGFSYNRKRNLYSAFERIDSVLYFDSKINEFQVRLLEN